MAKKNSGNLLEGLEPVNASKQPTEKQPIDKEDLLSGLNPVKKKESTEVETSSSGSGSEVGKSDSQQEEQVDERGIPFYQGEGFTQDVETQTQPQSPTIEVPKVEEAQLEEQRKKDEQLHSNTLSNIGSVLRDHYQDEDYKKKLAFENTEDLVTDVLYPKYVESNEELKDPLFLQKLREKINEQKQEYFTEKSIETFQKDFDKEFQKSLKVFDNNKLAKEATGYYMVESRFNQAMSDLGLNEEDAQTVRDYYELVSKARGKSGKLSPDEFKLYTQLEKQMESIRENAKLITKITPQGNEELVENNYKIDPNAPAKSLRSEYQKEYYLLKYLEDNRKQIIEQDLSGSIMEDVFGGYGKRQSTSQKAEQLNKKISETKAKLNALARALYLNENPIEAKEEWDWIDKTLSGFAGAGEGLAEFALDKLAPGASIQTEEDINIAALESLTDAGVNLTDQDIENARRGSINQFGYGLGQTLGYGAEIGLNMYMLNALGGANALDKGLKLLKIAKDSRKARVIKAALEQGKSAVAYEMAGQDALGGGVEKASEQGLDLLSKVLPKQLKSLNNFAVRRAVGGLSEGAAETLSGIATTMKDYGFDLNTAFKEVAGKDIESRFEYFATVTLMGSILSGGRALGDVEQRNNRKETLLQVSELEKMSKESGSETDKKTFEEVKKTLEVSDSEIEEFRKETEGMSEEELQEYLQKNEPKVEEVVGEETVKEPEAEVTEEAQLDEEKTIDGEEVEVTEEATTELESKVKEIEESIPVETQEATETVTEEGTTQEVEEVILTDEVLDADVTNEDGLKKAYDALDKMAKKPEEQRKGTLNAFGLPVAAAEVVVKTAREGVAAGMKLRDAINAGIEKVKETDWYKDQVKGKTEQEVKDIDNKIKSRFTEGKVGTETQMSKPDIDSETYKQRLDSYNELIKNYKDSGQISKVKVSDFKKAGERLGLSEADVRNTLDRFREKKKSVAEAKKVQQQVKKDTGQTDTSPEIKTTEKKALKERLKTISKSAREGGKFVAGKVKEAVTEATKGKANPRQLNAIVNKANSIAKRRNGRGFDSEAAIQELEQFIEKVLSDAEYSNRIAKVRDNVAKLKKEFKSRIKTTASDVVKVFDKINETSLSDSDLKKMESLTDEMLASAKGKTGLSSNFKSKVESFIESVNRAEEQAVIERNEQALKEEFEKNYSDIGMTFEEFKKNTDELGVLIGEETIQDIKAERNKKPKISGRKKDVLEKAALRAQERLVEFLKDQNNIEVFKKYKPITERDLRQIDASTLKEIIDAVNEVVVYGNDKSVMKIAKISEGVNTIKGLAGKLGDMFKSISTVGELTDNFLGTDRFIRLAAKSASVGNQMVAELTKPFQRGYIKARENSKKFNEQIEKMSRGYKRNTIGGKLGIVAKVMMYDKTLDADGIANHLESIKKSFKNQAENFDFIVNAKNEKELNRQESLLEDEVFDLEKKKDTLVSDINSFKKNRDQAIELAKEIKESNIEAIRKNRDNMLEMTESKKEKDSIKEKANSDIEKERERFENKRNQEQEKFTSLQEKISEQVAELDSKIGEAKVELKKVEVAKLAFTDSKLKSKYETTLKWLNQEVSYKGKKMRLVDAIQELESVEDALNLLTPKERKNLSYIKAHFAKNKPAFYDTIRQYKGEVPAEIENYVPTMAVTNLGKLSELDVIKGVGDFDTSVKQVSLEESGTAINRVPIDESGMTFYYYNLYDVAIKRNYEQEYDINTLGERIKLNAMVNNGYFQKAFGNKADLANAVKLRIAYQSSLRKANLFDTLGKAKGWKGNISKGFFQAVRAVSFTVLNRIDQYILQPVPVLTTSAMVAGRGFARAMMDIPSFVFNKETMRKLNELSEIGLREEGGERVFSETNALLYKILSLGRPGGNMLARTYKNWIGSSLGKPDKFAAGISNIALLRKAAAKEFGNSAYVDGINKLMDKINALEDSKKNLIISEADSKTSDINNESDYTNMGKMWTDPDKKNLRELVFNFLSFSINQKLAISNAVNNARNVSIKDALTSKEGRQELAENYGYLTRLALGHTAGNIMFNALKLSIIEMAYSAVGDLVLDAIGEGDDEDVLSSVKENARSMEEIAIAAGLKGVGDTAFEGIPGIDILSRNLFNIGYDMVKNATGIEVKDEDEDLFFETKLGGLSIGSSSLNLFADFAYNSTAAFMEYGESYSQTQDFIESVPYLNADYKIEEKKELKSKRVENLMEMFQALSMVLGEGTARKIFSEAEKQARKKRKDD